MVGMLDEDMKAFLADPKHPNLVKAVAQLEQLIVSLQQIREKDNEFIASAIPYINLAVNDVKLPPPTDPEATARYAFVLNRFSGAETELWCAGMLRLLCASVAFADPTVFAGRLEYVIGSLLSSRASYDLTKVRSASSLQLDWPGVAQFVPVVRS